MVRGGRLDPTFGILRSGRRALRAKNKG